MKIHALSLEGACLIVPEQKEDSRGSFARAYCQAEFLTSGLNINWLQMNRSKNKNAHTLRGLHFQLAPHEEEKLVFCTKGSIFDVIVDLRRNSKTFGKWEGVELNEDNQYEIFVPKGCAHGYVTLSEKTDVTYLVSAHYAPEFERCLRWDDPTVNINWPCPPLFISSKDKIGRSLMELSSYPNE
jgi:dTDP-4-dehydrorhamnose 3,5-epimerase